MAGPRPEKVAVVEEVREHLGGSSAAILTEYRGLKVGDLAALRRQLRTAGADYKIFKNTLVRRATADTDNAALDAYLKGPTAIVFVRDDIGAVAKVLRDFARVHPQLVVKGGLLGTQLLDANGANALADLPTREVLLAQLAGAIAAPMRQFAGLLQALPRSFAYGLSALIDSRGGVVETAEPSEVAEVSDAAEPDTAVAAEAAEPAEADTGVSAVTEASATAEPDTAVAAEAAEAAEAVTDASAVTEASATAEPAEAAAVTETSGTAEPAENADTAEVTDPAETADTADPTAD